MPFSAIISTLTIALFACLIPNSAESKPPIEQVWKINETQGMGLTAEDTVTGGYKSLGYAADAGFCFITRVAGTLDEGDEALVYVNGGIWQMKAEGEATSVSARCFLFE